MAAVNAEVFVVLKPFTQKESIFIGRNSLSGGPQEVVLFPEDEATASESKKLTNIKVTGASSSSVILSKPVGVWGAESGANDKHLAVALSYSANETDGLLGTDLVRLALERAVSAETAISVIADIVEKYGSDLSGIHAPIHCLVICDKNSAYLMNNIGKLWAVQKLERGIWKISPGISIGSKIDKCSDGFQEKLQLSNIWNGSDEINLKKLFENSSEENWIGEEPIEDSFTVKNMFNLLRSTGEGNNPQTSHVAVLSPNVFCNWFTGTPNPRESVFKPFIFTFGARISSLTKVSDGDDVTLLHKQHAQRKWEIVGSLLQSLETTCVEEIERFLNEHPGTPNQELDDLFKDCTEAEIKFYR